MDHPLAKAFLSRVDPESAGSCDVDALATRLSSIVEAAEERWGPIRIDRETFVAYLAARLPADRSVVAGLESLRADQLYLACACAAGSEPALARLEATYFPALNPALASLDRSGALVDEIKQRLRWKLFVSDGDRPPRIADYLGHGDLGRWLKAAAVRIGLDLLRGSRRDEDDAVLAALPADDADPELAHFQSTYGEELKAAFAEVLAARPAKDRVILRYHYVDRLTIDQIGAIFGVHRTTAFRRLEAARRSVVAETRKSLQRRLGIQREELDSIMRLVHSQLDLSIRRLLE